MKKIIFTLLIVCISKIGVFAQSWNLIGNGDATATSKLGTTNSQPVRIFVQNSEKMRIDSQGRVGIGTIVPNSSALVEIKSTNKGLLIPRMSKAQRDAIVTPTTGLMIYQINSAPGFYYFDDVWNFIGNSTTSANKNLSNLTSTTTINKDLKPDSSLRVNLGVPDSAWNDLYLKGAIFQNGARVFASLPTPSNLNTVPNLAVGANSMINTSISNNNLNNTGIGSLTLSVNQGGANTAVGSQALMSNTGGSANSVLGNQAMVSNSAGTFNTAVGNISLFSNSIGDDNTAIGAGTLVNNTSASGNTAIGKRAMFNSTIGFSNVAVGIDALVNSSDISNTVAIGDSALFKNGSAVGARGEKGERNTAVGSKSLFANTFGRNNTGVGYNTLMANTQGVNNTAMGVSGLSANTIGSNNTALGIFTLLSNTIGNENTAVGISALTANISGGGNTAIGSESLVDNINGSTNTAIGKSVMITNSNGSNNTGVGAFALLNTTSSGSTAVGVEAMKSNTSGFDNTALGKSAMLKNTSGIFNTAAGNEAMSENVTGNFNTAFGRSSLLINTAGSNNTALGYNAYNSTGTTFSNSTALGANSIITASNQIRTGNTAVTSIGGKVGWSTLSDGRFKTNVQQNIPGLNFINKLKPVSYQYNLVKLNQFTSRGVTTPEDEKAMSVAAAFTYSGFIAQDVEKTAKELGYDFSGVDAPKNDKDVYGLRYAEFVVPLVKAVQELSKQNEQLTIDNGQLKKTSEQLTMDNGQLKTQAADQEKRIAKLEALMQQLLNTKSTAPCPPLAGK